MEKLVKNKEEFTIAFYNLENLFDTIDNPDTNDDDFTPEGKKKWTLRRYKKKIKRLSKVITTIGNDTIGYPPVILGVAEVENYEVIYDLIQSNYLEMYNYGIIHYDSLDERGIEVALLYRKKYFELLDSRPYYIQFEKKIGNIDYTRDILLVKGKLNGELMYFIINHWPSRRSGKESSEYKRIRNAELVLKIITEINEESQNPKIIIMGDFNDNPNNKSIQQVLVTNDFYNPMESIYDKGSGTGNYKGKWFLFDQIIFSKTFLKEGMHTYKNAAIYDKHFLKDKFSKFVENPLRTYSGNWYKGGMSDHFPVFITLEKKNIK
ncbi:MAG: endonuclease [Flavobacteriaceae bacterium]|nr:endonuclease [Flavobacteriaceae bacterium]